MTTLDGICISESEYTSDIVVALPASTHGLASLKDVSPHNLIEQWKTRDTANTLCQFQALVVATLTKAFRSKGNGNNGIDTIEEMVYLHLTAHHAPHGFTNFRMILILQLIDDISSFCMRFMIIEGGSTFYVNLPP